MLRARVIMYSRRVMLSDAAGIATLVPTITLVAVCDEQRR